MEPGEPQAWELWLQQEAQPVTGESTALWSQDRGLAELQRHPSKPVQWDPPFWDGIRAGYSQDRDQPPRGRDSQWPKPPHPRFQLRGPVGADAPTGLRFAPHLPSPRWLVPWGLGGGSSEVACCPCRDPPPPAPPWDAL